MLKLIIMRGLPGSGKSTKAKSFGGKVLSTDDFFMKDGKYCFDVKQIGIAHANTQKLATEAMVASEPIIVIDNTNVSAWEMKHYVSEGLTHGYEISFEQPDSPLWNRFKTEVVEYYHKDHFVMERRKVQYAKEFESNNKHGVPAETILRMINRWEENITTDIVMNSSR